jgi:hypothetical protein
MKLSTNEIVYEYIWLKQKYKMMWL